MRTVRRFVRLAVVYLALGAAITIAISWAIAAWMPLRSTSSRRVIDDRRYSYQQALSIRIFRGLGWTRRSWELHTPGSDRRAAFVIPVLNPPLPLTIERDHPGALSWPMWGQVESVRCSPRSFPKDGCEHATGWPLPALWYDFASSFTAPGPRTIFTRNGIQLSLGQTTAPVEVQRALPFRPIRSGLIADSLFWALTTWSVSVLPGGIRRFRRLRRNHCPHCNYDLSASPTTCPECGWNRPDQPAPTSTATQPSPSSP